MTEQPDLERLYQDAKTALGAKDYDRASDLLRQILKADVDYKDAAQLLARVIKLSRRRWYNDPRTWGALGVLFLVGLGIYLFPKLQGLTTQPAPVILPTDTLSPTIASPATATATATLLPTPIPLTWKRVSIGQDFERDTVTAFATDKNDPDVIYAAMKNAGVYKTIDSGLSWRPAHQGLASTQVESLLIDSQNPQILYAGTLGGVFKTEDGGENWFRVGEGTYLLMDVQDNSHLYAHDENAIYETTDQGNNWTTSHVLKKDCPDEIHSWAIHPADGNILFLGGGETCAGVYQSNDEGHTWKLIGMKGIPNFDLLTISVNEEEAPSIYAKSASVGGLYVSYDEGTNWSITGIEGDLDIVTADTYNPSILYSASQSSMYVKRGKGSWQRIPDTQSTFYTAIYIDHPNGTDRILASGTNYGNQNNPYVSVLISKDGGSSWSKNSDGIGATRAELKIDPMDTERMYLGVYYSGHYAHSSCKLYRSQDGGKSWLSTIVASWCGPSFDTANAFYLIKAGSLQKSRDGGETWLWDFENFSNEQQKAAEEAKYFANRLPDWDRGVSFQSVSANPYIEELIYAIGNTIYYSTNAGYSWQPSTGSENLWDARLFYKDQGQTVYAIGRYHQAYSTDAGNTWQSCGTNVTASRSDSRLALDLQGLRLYLATPGQGVMISTDNCQSWQPSNKELSNLFVNTLALDPNDANKIYAGTDGGAYISYDAGVTWGQVNDGLLGATVVYSIAMDKNSNVFAATPYGIFKLENK
ncbi:MAG: hypothetical protein JW963_07390 [Anaerolineales bacterium]|nr:hypothetical protein [Anaerolineales bacterium]